MHGILGVGFWLVWFHRQTGFVVGTEDCFCRLFITFIVTLKIDSYARCCPMRFSCGGGNVGSPLSLGVVGGITGKI